MAYEVKRGHPEDTVYSGGMRKDKSAETKASFTLIDTGVLTRLAEHMAKGAKKYGRDNWRLASDAETVVWKDAAFRHMIQWIDGEVDEDHAIAVIANIMMHEGRKVKANGLDVPRTLTAREEFDRNHGNSGRYL